MKIQIVAMVLVALVSGCGQEECVEPDIPGFCTEDSDCSESDFCRLERRLDSHLVEPGEPETVSINRCEPKRGEDDFCENDSQCADELKCVRKDSEFGFCQE